MEQDSVMAENEKSSENTLKIATNPPDFRDLTSSPSSKRLKLDVEESVDTLKAENVVAKTSVNEDTEELRINENEVDVTVSQKNQKLQKISGQYNLRTKKTPVKKIRQNVRTNSELSVEMENEIDSVLEEKAWKNNLTAVNVKNILRHVITNEHVLAMVRNTMREENVSENNDNVEEAVYEPKLTRSKAKELIQKQENVPWPISPIKKPQNACKLMDREYSEEESSSDEEYKPEEESELDKSTNSVADIVQSSSQQENETANVQEELTTEQPIQPELTQETIDTLNELDSSDTIALRTRSKLPLVDTPLESIEATLVAPDVTTDMYYEFDFDDIYKDFLQDFCQQPLTEVNDDDIEDPEYNFLEEQEEFDSEDLRDDRAVKITKKEQSELMAECFESMAAELDLDDDDDSGDTAANVIEHTFRNSESVLNVVSETNCEETVNVVEEEKNVPLFGKFELMQLEEQMRKHVQLLVQGFILCSSVDELTNLKEMHRSLLIELQAFAIKNTISYGKLSVFNACNLTDGVELVGNFTDSCLSPRKLSKVAKKKSKEVTGYGLTPKAKDTIVDSKVFIYPEILPVCGFPIENNTKVAFSEAEDLLIALGLEQFCPLKNVFHIKLIQQNMLPTKTEDKIKVRIKNLKTAKAPNNPVKYYFQHQKLPELKRQVSEFNPNDIKTPIDQPSNLVPIWLQKKITAKSAIAIALIPIRPATADAIPTTLLPSSTEDNPQQIYLPPNILDPNSTADSPLNELPKTPEKNHSVITTTTTTNRVSPLKQISPILKKYSPKRLKKTGGNLQRSPKMILPKTIIKPLFISPKKSETRQIAPKPLPPPPPPPPPENICTVSSTTSNVEGVDEEDKSKMEGGDKKTQTENQHLSPNGETDSQSDAEMFDDGEEPLDNAEDLAALMAASTTIQSAPRGRHLMSGKRSSRQQRETQATVQLLAHDLIESDLLKDERDTAFAQNYLLRVKEMTKDKENLYESFVRLLFEFGQSEKSAVYLHREVCKLLKDYPSLCKDFVAFLMPEQALECGKLMDYLRFRQMRLLLRKIEVHFHQHPQHIHKVLKAFTQCQEQIHLGINHIKSIIQPLFRGRVHLMEEFLQLFPAEPVPESLMTDFEEVTLPDSDVEIDEDGFEIVTLPEDKHEFGGKNCQCQCHTQTDDLKLQKRIRHCVPCGTKFIDGRIYIQTGKALRPAQVVYLNKQEKSKTVPSSTVPETVIDCSECSSVSSLSPTDLKDSEEEKEISTTNVEQTKNAENVILTPAAVTEDAILTPDTSKSNADIPNDFSNLRLVIGQEIEKEKTVTPSEANLSAKNHSIDEKGEVVVLWTRSADRLILKSCQQLGATSVAFQLVSQQLGNKTADEVQERFAELIRLFSVQRSDVSSSDGSEMDD